MRRISPAAIAFGGAAIAVVVISALVTLRHGNAAARPQPTRFSGSTVVQRLPSILASQRVPEAITVDVVRDESAASFYDKPAMLDSIVSTWRLALAAAGANARVVGSAAARDDRSADVLVIPSSPCLTVATREALDGAAKRGVGVILTGAVGLYDAGCRPLGYGLIVEVTGASRAELLDGRDMTYVTIPSASPLAADIPPGARLELNPGRQVALRTPTRDAFYSDYALQPQPARDQTLLDAAVTHATIGGRRVVYWGFELSEVDNLPWNHAIVRLLVRNSVAWAAGRPVAAVEPWPLGKRAAASLAQDVESGFANARYAADSLHAAGVRSTFYLTSELAQGYARLSRRLAQFGEIGTHGDNHSLLGGLSLDQQHDRLATSQRDIARLVGIEVRGLRPPEEQFDTATMNAWLAVKGDYLFGANDSRAAAPELLNVGRDTLVLVGRVASDDFAVTARRAPNPDTLSSIFLGEYERVRALGGHYVLSYHSQVLAKADLVPALASVARHLAADTMVWVTTVGDVAEWWRARAQLEVRARVVGDRMRVVVHNEGHRPVRGAVVRITIPDSKRVVRSDAKLLPADAHTVRLVVPPVTARGTRTFVVSLADAKSP